MKSPIGLDTVQSQALAAELNKLLASYQILYMNVRGFHWNIRGNQFFELHLKFEEIYNDLLLKVDALAERILTLDGVPLHSFSDYIQVSAIPEQKGLHDGRACVESLLASFREVLRGHALGPLRRQYWAREHGQWKIFSETVSKD